MRTRFNVDKNVIIRALNNISGIKVTVLTKIVTNLIAYKIKSKSFGFWPT